MAVRTSRPSFSPSMCLCPLRSEELRTGVFREGVVGGGGARATADTARKHRATTLRFLEAVTPAVLHRLRKAAHYSPRCEKRTAGRATRLAATRYTPLHLWMGTDHVIDLRILFV